MPRTRGHASIDEREFADTDLGVVGHDLGLLWTLRGALNWGNAIDAPHSQAPAFVEPLIGLLVGRPMDLPEACVEMAKDDRPRKWSDAVVMADHRVVFLKGLLH